MTNQDISELKNYKALLFDCYGVSPLAPRTLPARTTSHQTLIDWERGMLDTPQVRKLLAQDSGLDEQGLLEAFSPNEVRVQAATPGIVYDKV